MTLFIFCIVFLGGWLLYRLTGFVIEVIDRRQEQARARRAAERRKAEFFRSAREEYAHWGWPR
jgi:hypothetical protein